MKSKFLAVFAGILMASMASAAPLVINGNLSTTDATFNRPTSSLVLSNVGTNVYYDAYYFMVSPSSPSIIETTFASFTGDDDTFLALYSGSFNAASPLTNLIAADDDSGAGLLSRIGVNLTSGVQYIAVVTSFNNNQTGAYQLQINDRYGSAYLTDAPVPEPGTCAMLLTGALGLVALKRRRS